MSNQKEPFPVGKVALSAGFIIASVAYALWQNFGARESLASASQAAQTPPATTNTPITITTSEPSQPKPIVAKAPPKKPAGEYADGSYTGTAADAYYGIVQVQAIIRGGKIADVRFLQYPNEHDNSRRINSEAMPLLTQEAIAAQSARVDGVSGATATSEAFAESLASALAQAKV